MPTVVDAAVDAARPGLADLAARCAAVDGHAPFEEHTLLTLDGPRQLPHARVELREGERLLGCALLSEGTQGWSLEAAVDPALRGRGHGRRLLAAAREHARSHGGGPVRAWLHGRQGAAHHLAVSAGATAVRRLLVLQRGLEALPPVPPVPVRPLDVASGAERDAWLRLTNAAFDGHPDNGGWTRADLDWRMDAAWTDGARLPVVEDDLGLVAGVWTKVEPGADEGELFVVAVAPRAQGRGLGGVVVARALHDLRAAGCRRAVLYVDAENAPAVALYRRAGFVDGVDHTCVEARA